MTRALAVLRPEPGNAVTVARARAAGFATLSLPLFAVVPLAWDVPDPAEHDALILTSANAVRHAGAGLERLRALPVFAVGARTAAAARAAGFGIARTGCEDAAALLAQAATQGVARALHLTGRNRTGIGGAPIRATIPVYASVAQDIALADLAVLRGTTALLHSMRAARRLAELVARAAMARGDIALAAFSRPIADAAGDGWAARAVAATPDDGALLAAAGRPPVPTKR